MTLPDDIRGEFAHLGAAVQINEAQIAEVERALERLPEAQVIEILTRLGYEVDEKRRAARAIAVAREVMAIVKVLALA